MNNNIQQIKSLTDAMILFPELIKTSRAIKVINQLAEQYILLGFLQATQSEISDQPLPHFDADAFDRGMTTRMGMPHVGLGCKNCGAMSCSCPELGLLTETQKPEAQAEKTPVKSALLKPNKKATLNGAPKKIGRISVFTPELDQLVLNKTISDAEIAAKAGVLVASVQSRRFHLRKTIKAVDVPAAAKPLPSAPMEPEPLEPEVEENVPEVPAQKSNDGLRSVKIDAKTTIWAKPGQTDQQAIDLYLANLRRSGKR